MKPSEAMRVGRKMVKGQAKEVFYRRDTDCACAMGCLWIGMGVEKGEFYSEDPELPNSTKEFYRFWEAYRKEYGETPYESNDDRGMTVEEIADRCEAIGF